MPPSKKRAADLTKHRVKYNRKSLAAAHTLRAHERCGNTDLLTCVMGQIPLRPPPAFSRVFPAMADFRPCESNRFGVVSRAQHRFVSALRPSSCAYPARKRALRNRRVLRYVRIQLNKEGSSAGSPADKEGTSLLATNHSMGHYMRRGALLQVLFGNFFAFQSRSNCSP